MSLSSVLLRVRLSTSSILKKTVPRKSHGSSSNDWLTRQLNDPYVKKARKDLFRARSAYKLQEIDGKHHLFHPGMVVIECGAAPGAWTQVIVPRINSLPKDTQQPQGLVIGIDLSSIYPLAGATFVGGCNFTSLETQAKILTILNGRKVDAVLSDMAPNASGMHELDHENIVALARSAMIFAITNTNEGGLFLCKLWDGHLREKIVAELNEKFTSVKVVKPPASRGDSAELFLLAKGFQPPR